MILCILAAIALFDLRYDEHIHFSRKSGYYDSGFYLRIFGGGGNEIHYTLDGSEPTINDPVFDRGNPIYLDDATNQANVHSVRTDVSTGFLVDLIELYSGGIPNYTVPDYNVDKCNIIRASIFDSSGNCIDSATGVYFVGFQDKDAYQNIYTASIVTSPENLFDNDIGIYITGTYFNTYLENGLGKEDNWATPYWWWWNSNYSNRGIGWEREATVTVFDEHQHVVLEEDCGIRIKGGGSRGYLPKSISCYARDIYGGSNNFHTDIFETGFFPHKFVFFSGGDDNIFKLKDYMVNTMEQGLHFATMDFIPCALFLDGEYWGTYYITEDYNADYIGDHYHVNNDNVIMVKSNSLSEGTEEDFERFTEWRSFILDYDMTDAENYQRACELMDMDSYIDYYAAQIYIGRNNDWPNGNYALWRTRENDGSRYGDCKWRWMLFDVNSGSMSISRLENDTLQYVLEVDPVFSSLYQNMEFRLDFARRILYIGGEVFAQEKCDSFLDYYVQTMKTSLLNSNMRFYMDTRVEEFEHNIEDMRTFFEKRYDIVWDSLVSNMGEDWLRQNGIQK